MSSKERHNSQTLSTRFIRSRVVVRNLFQYPPFQISVGVLLVAKFNMSAFESQMRDSLLLDDGRPSKITEVIDIADVLFLIIFTVELVLIFMVIGCQNF